MISLNLAPAAETSGPRHLRTTNPYILKYEEARAEAEAILEKASDALTDAELQAEPADFRRKAEASDMVPGAVLWAQRPDGAWSWSIVRIPMPLAMPSTGGWFPYFDDDGNERVAVDCWVEIMPEARTQ